MTLQFNALTKAGLATTVLVLGFASGAIPWLWGAFLALLQFIVNAAVIIIFAPIALGLCAAVSMAMRR